MLVPGVLERGVLGLVGVLRGAENPPPEFDLDASTTPARRA